MKPTFFAPAVTLLFAAITLQSCITGASLVKSTNYSVTHEHRVDLPASMYSPGVSQTPMFDKKGEIAISAHMTNSGENENNDPNPTADPAKIKDGLTRQNISKVRTFSFGGGYALTDKIGLLLNFNVGKGADEHNPYIESWNLTEDLYTYEYWAGIPLGWNEWIGGTWYASDEITTLNDYQRIGKTLQRSYQYFDVEAAVGKYMSRDWLRTGFYGGLGIARNQYQGHLTRDNIRETYGQHDATFLKVFILPSVAVHKDWFELGASMKSSYLGYNLHATEVYGAAKESLIFVEPALFLRVGPRYLQLSVEQKWLGSLGDAPFKTNKAFTSVGVLSTF